MFIFAINDIWIMSFAFENKSVAKMFAVVCLVLFLSHPFSFFGQETFVDGRDNNSYGVVTIGDQVWMSENMRYLPNVSSPKNMSDEDYYTAKYYVYGYDGTDVSEAKNLNEYSTYGVLYNQTAARSACPSGWHLPKDSEWKKLEKNLGMQGNATKQIGNRGTYQGVYLAGNAKLWSENGSMSFKNHMFGTSGFMALPAGFMGNDKKFHELGVKASFWTATEYCDGYSYYRSIGVNSLAVYRINADNRTGMSVRCIKD